MTGRVVDPESNPIPGATVRLWSNAGDAGDAAGGHATETDADGGFDVSAPGNQAGGLALAIHADGYVQASWTLAPRETDPRFELGEIVLVPAARLTCIVTAPDGAWLALHGWSVVVEQPAPGPASGRQGFRRTSRECARTGHFEFDEVPCGPLSVRLQMGDGWVAGGERVHLRPGESGLVEIACRVPGARDAVFLRVECPPWGLVPPSRIAAIELEDAAGRRVQAVPPRDGNPFFTFPGCGAGDHRLHIRGEAFQAWTREGVRRGDFVDARLAGSAGLHVLFPASESGRAPDGLELRVSLAAPDFGPEPRLVRGRAVADAIVFEGLIPGAQSLVFSAPGFATIRMPAQVLAPAEQRSLHLALARGRSIEGRVVERNSRRGVSGVQVLLRPAEPADADPAPSPAVASIRSRPSAPVSGQFRFEGLAPGTYRAQAAASALHVSEEVTVVVSASEDLRDLEIALDAPGGVQGRIRAPAGARFDGLRAVVAPLRHVLAPDGRVRDAALRCEVAARITTDGAFRTGPLPAGPARVVLVMPELSVPSGSGGTLSTGGGTLDLGVVEIEAGAWTEHTFDATDAFPGTVEIVCSLDGHPAWGHVVELQEDKGTHLHPRAGGVVPPSGRLSLGPLAAGTYVATVRPPQADWVWTAPQRVRVTNAGQARLECHVTTASGSVRILDRAGNPAPERAVRLRAVAQPPTRGAQRTTDGTGRLRLTLPPGRYALEPEPVRGSAFARIEFDWPQGVATEPGLTLPE